jgi:uncharacterized protein with PQ loop repeat
MLADVVGWAGTVTGILLGLPQLIRLARTRSVEGLSVPAWQAFLTINIAWTIHGLSIGQAPQAVAGALSLASTVPILYLMSRQLRRSFFVTILPGLVMATVLVVIDQVFGSGVFGAVSIIPTVIANAGQSVALIRAQHVRGVSVLFLMLAVLNQVFWVSWAALVADLGTMIGSVTTGVIALFNLSWFTARRLGLPAIWPYPARSPRVREARRRSPGDST